MFLISTSKNSEQSESIQPSLFPGPNFHYSNTLYVFQAIRCSVNVLNVFVYSRRSNYASLNSAAKINLKKQ